MSKTARDTCESILRENIRYNIENEILPSANVIAERLLSRGDELTGMYDEVYEKLHRRPHALRQFLGMLLTAQTFWNPERIAEARVARDALKEINGKIEQHARALAELLERRTQLHNTSGFSSDTLYHICDVIDAAGQGNGHYRSFLRAPLQRLQGQFDLKYWPELSDCLLVIAEDAADADVEATDPLTEAATTSSRPSPSDSVRMLLACIEDCRGDYDGWLPRDFRVSDKHMATIMNVLLDLPSEKLLSAEYIKNLRKKVREAEKKP